MSFAADLSFSAIDRVAAINLTFAAVGSVAVTFGAIAAVAVVPFVPFVAFVAFVAADSEPVTAAVGSVAVVAFVAVADCKIVLQLYC